MWGYSTQHGKEFYIVKKMRGDHGKIGKLGSNPGYI